jgi:hypothetical protein
MVDTKETARSLVVANLAADPGLMAGLGVLALGLGIFLLFRSGRALRRRGVHTEAFWATLREHARYRRRALPSAGGVLLALLLLGAGAYLSYKALLSFYAGRFAKP